MAVLSIKKVALAHNLHGIAAFASPAAPVIFQIPERRTGYMA